MTMVVVLLGPGDLGAMLETICSAALTASKTYHPHQSFTFFNHH